jgi:hypothetical protein
MLGTTVKDMVLESSIDIRIPSQVFRLVITRKALAAVGIAPTWTEVV